MVSAADLRAKLPAWKPAKPLPLPPWSLWSPE
jgi:hypothetical protein